MKHFDLKAGARVVVLVPLLLGAGCVGVIDGSSGPTEGKPPAGGGGPTSRPPGGADPITMPPPPSIQLGPAGLRRLTRVQYTQAVSDLLGPDITLPSGLELDSVLSGFAAIGSSLTTYSETITEKLEGAALAIATQALAPERRARLVSCTPAGGWDEACARTFITTFGRRAWRRPLVAEEVTAYVGLANQGATMLGDFWQGLTYTLSAILQSPHFLYRVEVGTPGSTPGVRAFDDWALASRLSFFLAGTTPDDALLNAAEARALTRAGGLRREAERLLDGPRGPLATREFFNELLRLGALDDLEQSATDFPALTATLAPAMREETLRFVTEIVRAGDGDYRRVFDTRTTFLNAELAKLYGLPAPTGTAFQPVTIPDNNLRVGLLGQSAFLAPNAHEKLTSPTLRGKFLREVLLCHAIPEPPADVDTTLPPDRAGTAPRTVREKLEVHAAPACSPCHSKMDPLGFAFENFDALGKFRTTEVGKPIDASGDLDGQRFTNAVELAAILRQHPDVENCLVRNLWRYALGRVETASEEPLLARLTAGIGGANRFRTLLLGLVESEGFRMAGEAQ